MGLGNSITCQYHNSQIALCIGFAMNDLKDKNILITGASSGIGKTCAIECSKAGATVHLVGRDLKRLENAFTLLCGDGHSYHELDVTDTSKLNIMIDGIVEKTGKISGFIHSAGYQITTPLQAMVSEQYNDIFGVNTISAFEISRIISKKKNYSVDGLSIVLIASVMSVVANAGLIAYCASKAALVGGARAMAIELAPKKIRVNCISPGYMSDTPMMRDMDFLLSQSEIAELTKGYPLGLGKTEDIASMCVYLLSEKAKWITGQNIIIDGGFLA